MLWRDHRASTRPLCVGAAAELYGSSDVQAHKEGPPSMTDSLHVKSRMLSFVLTKPSVDEVVALADQICVITTLGRQLKNASASFPAASDKELLPDKFNSLGQ